MNSLFLLAALVLSEDGNPGSSAPASCRLIDLTGDGSPDKLFLGSNGEISVAVHYGGRVYQPIPQELPQVVVRSVLADDLDLDGLTDLYLVSPSANVALQGDGTGYFWDATEALGLGDAGNGIEAERVDLDGDGLLDLLLHNVQGDAVFWARGNGTYVRDEDTPDPTGADDPAAPGHGPDSTGTGVPGTDPGPGSGGAATGPGGSITYGPGPGSGPPPGLDLRAGGLDGRPKQGSPSPPPIIPPVILSVLDDEYVNDNEGEVDSADVADGSLTGADVSTSSGNVTHTGGSVGIGTASPTAALDVAGSARVTGTLTLAPGVDQALDVSTGSIYKGGALFLHTKGGAANTAVGRGALTSVTTGFDNTAFGYQALSSNTTGFQNSAFGYKALSVNTTGFSNTASGYRALSANTIGIENTASGYRALLSNTTGYFNTAVGSNALLSNTIGDFNTAVGYRALKANTTGDFNTASGTGALRFNTTGSQNTASGYGALYSNTTGLSNTACGHKALYANTTGNSNIASGEEALLSNTNGGGNIAIGVRALRDCTSGGSNAAAGHRALENTTGSFNTGCGNFALYTNTSGSSNIALGSAAGLSLTTGSNNIAIGNSGVAGESSTIRVGTSGTHTRAFIAGIRGVTTGTANAITVLIDSAGQLGTVSSSRRFKEDIADMGDHTARLLELRPVVFRYKPEVQEGERPLEYGLIAEEVAEVFPDLVVYDEEGLPFTVKYHLLSAMLLNELRELHARFETRSSEHTTALEGLRSRLAAVESGRLSAPRPAATVLVPR